MRAIGELEDRGCEAAGYRLSGEVLDHICCQHLYGQDRMLIIWPSEQHAIVVLVSAHDRGGSDVYAHLLEVLDVAMPATERDKPPCCDDEGQPPVDFDGATAIADAVDQRRRRRR